MNVNDLRQSKYLKKEEFDTPATVTISGVHQENVAKEGAEEELRWIMTFAELDKGLVLNTTNGQLIERITGQRESEDWIGKKIVLYHEPNVTFGGKLLGGIRVRAPKAPKSLPHNGDDDEIPF
jgi:hypothetical protein